MWLLAGLGNPGERYAAHRHNVGFMLVDAIAEQYDFPPFSERSGALVSKHRIAEIDAVLCKPQSYMNRSGQPAGEVARFFRIPTGQVLVFHDELDLPPGKIRLKQGGGSGGHNGLKSLDAHLGNDYWRLRFGIGHPGHKDRVQSYVLSDFSKDERELVAQRCEVVACELPVFFTQGQAALMNRLALAFSTK